MNYIKSSKFHTIVLVKRYMRDFNVDEVTISTLLATYLSLSNNKYRTAMEYTAFLDANYGMIPSVRNLSFGDYSCLSFSMLAIHPKWIKDPDYTLDMINETFELSFNHPNVVKDRFEIEMFELAKNQVKTAILHYQDDKRALATKMALATFLKKDFKELFGECSMDELNSITPKDLYEYYKTFMNCPSVSYIDGDIDFEQSTEEQTLCYPSYCKKRERYTAPIEEKIDYKNVDQMYLRVFFEGAPFYDSIEESIHMSLANYILGGAPTSRLFLNIREKQGLCYDISSSYYSTFGFVVVSLGIDPKNKDKALQEIDNQLESLLSNEITEEELINYKRKLINSIKASIDNRSKEVEEIFVMKTFKDRSTSTEEKIQLINETSKEDIKKSLSSLKRVYHYAMTRGENNDL